MRRQFFVIAGLLTSIAGYLIFAQPFRHAVSSAVVAHAAESTSITISSSVPTDLNKSNGGAPAATLQQAADFAWQEFIALNWPAVKQTGAVGDRDQPDNNCLFGDPHCTGPLVWETFRSKVEIFPGVGNPPGYPGASSDDSHGYDALPQYNYVTGVPPCDVPPGSQIVLPTPWINLDETDQITLDSMYAGIAPTKVAGNSAPQLIRFLAKANREEYRYVTDNQWWSQIPSAIRTATIQYLTNNQYSPPPGSSQHVSLREGTIEAKAAWRELTLGEVASHRFVTATARYYEMKNSAYCYRQHLFGLVALHLIQKTSTAPYFIYASFEQADNILDAKGKAVEDDDGNLKHAAPVCVPGQDPTCPTYPSVVLEDTPVVSPSGIPPQVNLVPSGSSYCTASTSTAPVNRLYYLNSSGESALPTAGFICINYRDNLIPGTIIDANHAAHEAIRTYDADQKIPDSPWLHYKLVNVQYQPIDKNYAGVYNGNDTTSDHNAASYHMANIVVETNRPLQLFSGSLTPNGTNSDYDSQFGGTGTAIHRNIYYGGSQLNMGGCMGCHGAQGQHQQGDFSVILAKGKVRFPESPAPATSAGAAPTERNRALAYR
jgi:hypothetical protein